MNARTGRYLLGVIYLGFFSLGLPDGTLGVAWPAMHGALGMAVGVAGPLLLWVTLLAAASSFASGALGRRFAVGPIVTVSCAMTGVGLLLISQAQGMGWLVVAALPLGLGAGAVDASLNSYVAKHYEARHMNWLHAFWGVGATSGPLVIASCLGMTDGWRMGYVIIAGVQLSLVVLFATTLRWWNEVPERIAVKVNPDDSGRASALLKGANSEAGNLSAAIFAIYVGVEITVGLWIATNLVETRGASLVGAGYIATGYFGAIALGRVSSGFVVGRWGNRRIIAGGVSLALGGAGLFLGGDSVTVAGLGILLMGLGFAPIYPGLMHEVPQRFKPDAVQTVIGRQTAAAYIGGALVPAFSGWLVQVGTVSMVPWLAVGGVALLGLVIWRMDRLTRD
jgi:fucose permease